MYTHNAYRIQVYMTFTHYIIIKLFTVYTFMSCTTMVVKYMYVCHMSCVHILYVKVVCLGTPHEMAIIYVPYVPQVQVL